MQNPKVLATLVLAVFCFSQASMGGPSGQEILADNVALSNAALKGPWSPLEVVQIGEFWEYIQANRNELLAIRPDGEATLADNVALSNATMELVREQILNPLQMVSVGEAWEKMRRKGLPLVNPPKFETKKEKARYNQQTRDLILGVFSKFLGPKKLSIRQAAILVSLLHAKKVDFKNFKAFSNQGPEVKSMSGDEEANRTCDSVL